MNKTEMLVFILFGTAYEIKIVAGKRRYNISCQTKSSERTITSDTIIPSQTFTANGDPPRTHTLAANVRILESSRLLDKQTSASRAGKATHGYPNARTHRT